MATLADEQAFVTNAYHYILSRSAADIASAGTQADIAAWAAAISSGTFSESQVAVMFATSAEATAYVLPIVELYEAFYHRPPDATGLNAWVNAYRGGDPLDQVAQAFSAGDEFQSVYGSNPTPTAFVASLYQNVLGRAPDAAGLGAWVSYLGGANATLSSTKAAALAVTFVQSDEARALDTGPIQSWLAAGVNGTFPGGNFGGNAYVLTEQTESITGSHGNDVFTASAFTGGGDSLTGNGGNDTFYFMAQSSVPGAGNYATITDFVANTVGQGSGGAVTAAGAPLAPNYLTGDIVRIRAGSSSAIVVGVVSSAADAQTYLVNHHGAGTVVAALDATTGNVYIDNLGSGVAGNSDGQADLFIHLTGVTSLNAAAFQLVA